LIFRQPLVLPAWPLVGRQAMLQLLVNLPSKTLVWAWQSQNPMLQSFCKSQFLSSLTANTTFWNILRVETWRCANQKSIFFPGKTLILFPNFWPIKRNDFLGSLYASCLRNGFHFLILFFTILTRYILYLGSWDL
jgi:hypothetical protein